MRDETPEMDPFSEFLIRHPERGERVFKLIREGQKLLDSGRIKAAERKFRDATRICECAIPALNNLALCASLRGETKRAIRTAHQALEYHPTNVFAHCTLAECYEELGRTEKARFHIERAIVLLEDPGVPLDKLTKVIEALATLQWDEKIDQVYRSYREGVGFEEVLDGISWFYIGVAAANLGHVEEALALWDRARGEEPRFGLPELYTTAALLVQEGKAPSFRFSYTSGKRENPGSAAPRRGDQTGPSGGNLERKGRSASRCGRDVGNLGGPLGRGVPPLDPYATGASRRAQGSRSQRLIDRGSLPKTRRSRCSLKERGVRLLSTGKRSLLHLLRR